MLKLNQSELRIEGAKIEDGEGEVIVANQSDLFLNNLQIQNTTSNYSLLEISGSVLNFANSTVQQNYVGSAVMTLSNVNATIFQSVFKDNTNLIGSGTNTMKVNGSSQIDVTYSNFDTLNFLKSERINGTYIKVEEAGEV